MEIKELTQTQDDVPIPRIIGLTGGIGSGKTSVAKMLQENGFPVYYSDDRAKDIVNDNPTLKKAIVDLLGEEAYVDGEYNRKYVSQLVFNDQEKLLQLNQLIHPAVRIDFENWVKNQKSKYLFKETALLFELKLHEQCYKSLLVTAEDNLRMKRVMDRDNKSYREVEAVMKKQMSEKEKLKLSDFVIHNNSNLEDLRKEVNRFIDQLENNY